MAPSLVGGPGGHVGAVAEFAVVIAEDEVKGGGVAEEAEVVALGEVLRGGFLVGVAFVDHEGIAQGEVEVTLIGDDVAEGVGVEFGDDAVIEMGVSLDGEDEGAAGWSGGVKGFDLSACEVARATFAGVDLVVVAGVGLQISKDKIAGSSRLH